MQNFLKKFNRSIFVSLFLLSPLKINDLEVKSKEPTFKEVLSKRYSGTAFDPNRSVSRTQVIKLLEATRLTPSSFNDQPWYFIITDRYSNLESYNIALRSLDKANTNWAKNAPLLVIVLAATHYRRGKVNPWASYDTGAAAYGLSLVATSFGLISHEIGGFDPQMIIEEFEIPDGFQPLAIIAIGYPTPEACQPERKRLPLEQNFFFDSWNNSWEK